MKAVLVLPEMDRASFAANLVDRPFLRHVVEFMFDGGIRDIVMVGPSARQAQSLLEKGYQWDVPISYLETHSPADYELTAITGAGRCLIAAAACLPRFPLERSLELSAGTIVYGASDGTWTGWAVIEAEDVARMPPLCDRAAVLSYLQRIGNYNRLIAEWEFRCNSAEDLWRAHREAQQSNLSGICHGGVEVKPGVWMGRNVSVAADARIIAPVYIGENSRIGAGAQIGPFAVIARDCLIAPATTVRDSVVAPGTYAGNNLELNHVLVNKRQLFDVRFGVSIDRVDSTILDGVFDFHWSAIPSLVYGALSSRMASLFTPKPDWPPRRAEARQGPDPGADTD